MFRSFCAVFVLLLVGCGSQPTMKLSSYEDVQPEIKRVSEKLEPAKAAEFKTAAEVLSLHAAKSATSEDGQKLAPVSALNGKTPDAIIAEYNKLDPEFRRQTGTAIAEVRTLKDANDYQERSLKRWLELEKLTDKYTDLSSALAWSSSIRDNKRILEGKLAAEKWFAEELDMTPEQLVAKYGDLKGLDLVEASNKEVEAFKKK